MRSGPRLIGYVVPASEPGPLPTSGHCEEPTARNDGETITQRSRDRLCPRYANHSPRVGRTRPSKRARGRPARTAPAVPCAFDALEIRTRAYRFSGNTPAFRAQWHLRLLRALWQASCASIAPKKRCFLGILACPALGLRHTTSPCRSHHSSNVNAAPILPAPNAISAVDHAPPVRQRDNAAGDFRRIDSLRQFSTTGDH